MAESIPRVGASLAVLDHRLLLVVPGAPKLPFFEWQLPNPTDFSTVLNI